MMFARNLGTALAAAALLMSGACRGDAGASAPVEQAVQKVEVTIQTAAGPRIFHVEVARTPQQQERGLMFRTNIPEDGGMLFSPYPGDGGPPREASFWMKNTPSPLDIIFIRPDGTIAAIAENTIPFSQESVKSGEPVNAVLEINGGVASKLGIAAGDKVSWAGQGR